MDTWALVRRDAHYFSFQSRWTFVEYMKKFVCKFLKQVRSHIFVYVPVPLFTFSTLWYLCTETNKRLLKACQYMCQCDFKESKSR